MEVNRDEIMLGLAYFVLRHAPVLEELKSTALLVDFCLPLLSSVSNSLAAELGSFLVVSLLLLFLLKFSESRRL